jgi:hypothetical protein
MNDDITLHLPVTPGVESMSDACFGLLIADLGFGPDVVSDPRAFRGTLASLDERLAVDLRDASPVPIR